MKKKIKPEKEAVADYGTPEMSRRFQIIPKLSSPTTMTGKVMNGTEIDRMLLTDTINPVQHSTLNLFLKKLLSYGFMGLRSPDYSSPIHADATAIGDKKAAAIRGAVVLFDKMDKHPEIKQYKRKMLVNLVLHDAKWNKKAGDLHTVIHALDSLMNNRR